MYATAPYSDKQDSNVIRSAHELDPMSFATKVIVVVYIGHGHSLWCVPERKYENSLLFEIAS